MVEDHTELQMEDTIQTGMAVLVNGHLHHLHQGVEMVQRDLTMEDHLDNHQVFQVNLCTTT
jgi:hypothetical protein